MGEQNGGGISTDKARQVLGLQRQLRDVTAERDALQAQLREMESPCDSCGAALRYPREDSTCRGCGMVICYECVTAFDHWGDGEHGTGNPSDYLLSLRAQLREAQEQAAEAARLAERVRELERENAELTESVEALSRGFADLNDACVRIIDAARERSK